MKSNREAKLIAHGVILELHELSTVTFLSGFCQTTIELIPPSHTPGVRTPDFVMWGIMWEMKSPQGKELRTIEHAFKNAAKQSENIVIDLRRNNVDVDSAVKLLKKRFDLSRQVKRMLIITKDENVIDSRKKSY